ncbi:hypothetical protein [Tepidibacillus sp. HK-1]|uniref:hypothetical protein n=1 Tax=Tepidibacillus sp. HK-1 TaxID=1883407 RepID=UPI0008531A23|nr:hypothetical protein [Tepidibacillus sp. HK-1]GBF10554.1 flagellar protein FliT [Tepidibacillus sp. HK-1]
MSLVKQLYEVANQFYQYLLIQPQKEQRDAYIEQINQFLDRREELISKLPKVLDDEEKILGGKIIQLNHSIDELLKKRYDEIEADLKQIRQQKMVQQKYAQTVVSVSFDGMFFDKRK